MSQLEARLLSLRSRYDPTRVSHETVYYLTLGDEPGDKWTVTLTPSACTIAPGRVGTAHCVLKMRAALFVELLDGSFEPKARDFMLGRIKTNDVGLLLTLRQAFGF